MDIKISKQANDIIQKYMSGLFKDTVLDFYGIHTAPVKELVNVELPVVEVKDSSTDYIFLLEDNSYLHLEFQSTYSRSDLIRFAMYDLRLFERDQRDIHTVIVYTSDVSREPDGLQLSTLAYTPAKVMMIGYDGDRIYEELKEKIESGARLTDQDIVNLVFLPLMKSKVSRYELAKNVITLAQSIPDKTKKDACIASAFAFASKYLHKDEINEIWEVLKMYAVLTRLITQEVEKGIEKGIEKELAQRVEKELAQRVEKLEKELTQRAEKELAQKVEKELAQKVEKELAQKVEKELAQRVEKEVEEEKLEIALNLIEMGMPLNKIAEATGLTQDEIEQLHIKN